MSLVSELLPTSIDVEGLRAAERQRVVEHLRGIRAGIARQDPDEFARFVLRDEETGERVLQEPKHTQWQDIIDNHRRVVLLSHIESGKSVQITAGRTLHEIGVNPNIRGAIISNAEKQAIKFMRPIRRTIEENPDWAITFPDVKPAFPWQETQITVTRSNSTTRDPTIQAVGIEGKILGSRLDWVVGDDILDKENTKSMHVRNEVWDWFHAHVMGRLTRNARVILLGTAWNRDDLLHRLGRRKKWFFRRFPAWNPQKDCSLSSRWPLPRIKEAKETDFTDLEFRRQILVQASSDDDDTGMSQKYIDTCSRLGVGIPLAPNMAVLRAIPSPEFTRSGQRYARQDGQRKNMFAAIPRLFGADPPVMIGVDLASASRGKRTGKVVFFALAIHPDDKRQPIWVESGKFDGPTIVEKIKDLHDRFNAVFWVENNGVQDWIRQFVLADSVVPIHPFNTGRNKADPDFGVDSLATEFRNGGWIIPCSERGQDEFEYDDEIEEWLGQLRDYERDKHTGDHVMASWFAREGARRMIAMRRRRARRSRGVRVIGGRR